MRARVGDGAAGVADAVGAADVGVEAAEGVEADADHDDAPGMANDSVAVSDGASVAPGAAGEGEGTDTDASARRFSQTLQLGLTQHIG